MHSPMMPPPLKKNLSFSQERLGRAFGPGEVRAAGVVGPLGFEPRTKGFKTPERFRSAWTVSPPTA